MKVGSVLAIITVAVMGWWPDAVAAKESYCTWNGANQAIVEQADATLNLTPSKVTIALDRHLPFGIPQNPPNADNESLLISEHFIINYDADLLMATWTAHRLGKQDIVSRTRHDAFRSDPRLPSDDRSFCADYKESIFDQGHLVPRADMNRSEIAMLNTFVMSNMAPQHCAFNRGPWRHLEHMVREWAKLNGDIFVFTGAIFDRDLEIGRDPDGYAVGMYSEPFKERRVAIPTQFYKIALRKLTDGTWDAIAVVLPNMPTKVSLADTPQYLADHIRSIDFVELYTGIKFLPDLDQTAEEALSSAVANKLWDIADGDNSNLAGNCKAVYPSF